MHATFLVPVALIRRSIKPLLAGVFSLGVPCGAAAKPFTCAELSSFVGSIASYRDQGVSLQVAEKAVLQGTMSDSDKVRFVRVVREIYSSPSIPPAAMAVLAMTSCKQTGRR